MVVRWSWFWKLLINLVFWLVMSTVLQQYNHKSDRHLIIFALISIAIGRPFLWILIPTIFDQSCVASKFLWEFQVVDHFWSEESWSFYRPKQFDIPESVFILPSVVSWLGILCSIWQTEILYCFRYHFTSIINIPSIIFFIDETWFMNILTIIIGSSQFQADRIWIPFNCCSLLHTSL